MAKKTTTKQEENKLSLVVDFSGFVELPEGVTPEKRAEEIKTQIKELSIQTLEDKEHYKVGRKMLTDLITLRTTIEKVRKEKNVPIADAKKKIDDTAKTLTSIFQTLESELSTKVKLYEKLEEDEKNKEKIRNQARQQYLLDNHFPYAVDAFSCVLNGETLATITPRIISMSSDAEWETIVKNIIAPNALRVTEHLTEKAKQEEADRKAFEEFKANQAKVEHNETPIDTPTKILAEAELIGDPKGVLSSVKITPEVDDSGLVVSENSDVNTLQQTNFSKAEVSEKMNRILVLFKQLNPHGTALIQLEAIIKSEIAKL